MFLYIFKIIKIFYFDFIAKADRHNFQSMSVVPLTQKCQTSEDVLQKHSDK